MFFKLCSRAPNTSIKSLENDQILDLSSNDIVSNEIHQDKIIVSASRSNSDNSFISILFERFRNKDSF